MNKKISYLCMIIIVLLYEACALKDNDNCHHSITIINIGDFDIYYSISPDVPISAQVLVSNPQFYKIGTHTSKKDRWRNCIEYEFTIGTSFSDGRFEPLDSMKVYIFDAHVLEQELKYKTLRRYDLGLKDFKHLNWKISYPPNEEMKDVVMHPPYRSE